jgi:hypothetical protein
MLQAAVSRLAVLAMLVVLLPGASIPARAAESAAFKFVLDIELGTSVTEGVVPVIGNRFAISEITWFRRVDLSGAIDGDRIRVTGDWNGNYMSGECKAAHGQCQLTFQTTGTIYSAFISLSVH